MLCGEIFGSSHSVIQVEFFVKSVNLSNFEEVSQSPVIGSLVLDWLVTHSITAGNECFTNATDSHVVQQVLILTTDFQILLHFQKHLLVFNLKAFSTLHLCELVVRF